MAVSALLCLVAASPVRTLAQTPPSAPTIDSVTFGDGALTIAWTAPAGVTGITAYDLRYIRSDTTDKSDANWTEVDDAWTTRAGALEYVLGGLDNGVGYDVQLRTVTTADGAWSGTSTGTPRIPGPTITSVVVGDGALSVVWMAPSVAATTVIGAYDLRYIETSADETVDANWAVVEDFWTSGDLQGVLAELTNGTGYDVQVRVAGDPDGAWSATSTGTPAEHGGTTLTATTLTLGTPLGGRIDPGTDEDFFKLELSGAADILILTRGDLDTVGQLLDTNGDLIKESDKGDETDGVSNFLIWDTLAAGTYYIKVTSKDAATGSYILETATIADSTGTSDAQPVEVGSSRYGIMHSPDDTDWFSFRLEERTTVIVYSTSAIGLSGWVHGHLFTGEDVPVPGVFVLITLDSGTYYVRVSASQEAGAYRLHVNRAAEPGNTLETALPLPLNSGAAGRIDPAADVDYFRIDLDRATQVKLDAESNDFDLAAELLDSNGEPVDATLLHEPPLFSGRIGVALLDRLEAGTYYLKLTRSGGDETGDYGLRLSEDFSYIRLLNPCLAIDTLQSDPLYGCQWHLKNTGQLGGTAGEDINVEDVWAAGQLGAGVTVAVVDDGLDYAHRDLRDNVIQDRNHDYTGGDDVYDRGETHGTEVAGIIAARDNDVGVRGVAPRASIYAYNLLVEFTDANKADAMTRGMADTAVMNNSWARTSGPGIFNRPRSGKQR